VPANTYVSDIHADRFDASVVYASFNNHKRDDFKPYILKSTDKGQTWTSIANNLPANGSVHTIQQDFVNKDLLFAGTEFGAYFSIDGGKEWVELSAGLPDISVKDIVIQERENDLAIATFGRGFYILDDYTPLRNFSKDILEKDAHIFPIKDAKMYMQTGGKYGQGAGLYSSDNPEFGAVFTYYLKEAPKSLKQKRQDEEKKLFKDKKPIPQPGVEELRAEMNQEPSYLLFTIYDQDGNEIRRIIQKPSKGIKRFSWDLSYDSPRQNSSNVQEFNPFASRGGGYFAMPGTYSIGLHLSENGQLTKLLDPVEFKAEALNNTTLPANDRAAMVAFNLEVSRLSVSMTNAESSAEYQLQKAHQIKQTLLHMPGAPRDLMDQASKIIGELDEVLFAFNGFSAGASREESPPGPVSLNSRLRAMAYASRSSTSDVTQSQKDNLQIIKEELPALQEKIKETRSKVKILEEKLDEMGAPWTTGR